MLTYVQEATSQLDVVVVEVAGSFELPLAAKLQLKQGVDAVIALGAIERGETGHGEMLATAVFPALMNLGLEFEKPVALGIIGPNATREQIESRAEPVANEAVQAVLMQFANVIPG
jgi:6,7-dimethyl-8-ribityllumazine synthase